MCRIAQNWPTHFCNGLLYCPTLNRIMQWNIYWYRNNFTATHTQHWEYSNVNLTHVHGHNTSRTNCFIAPIELFLQCRGFDQGCDTWPHMFSAVKSSSASIAIQRWARLGHINSKWCTILTRNELRTLSLSTAAWDLSTSYNVTKAHYYQRSVKGRSLYFDTCNW